jgi:virginiamycin B lyase
MPRFRPVPGLILAIAALAGCQSAPPAMPVPTEIIEYVIPWENAFPNDVVVDTAGAVWFTDRITHVVGRFDPMTGSFSRFSPPTEKSAPYGLIVAPDGGLWYAASTAGILGRVDPASGGIEEHVIPGATGGPQQLVMLDGVIWFSLREANALGRYDPRTGESRLLTVEGRLRPYAVTVTPTGRIWYNTLDNGYLIEVDPRTDALRIHDLGERPATGPFATMRYVDADGRPRMRAISDSAEYAALPDSLRMTANINRVRPRARRLASDPDGAIWLTDHGGSRIVRFDPANRTLTSFRSLDRGTRPYGIAVSRQGTVVYSDAGLDAITILDPVSGERTSLRLPTPDGAVRQIWIDDRRGNIWLPMSDVGRLAVARARQDP